MSSQSACQEYMDEWKLELDRIAGSGAKARDTAEHIVRATMATFVELGFHRVTMRCVADKAGVSLGNLTYYFPSKKVLLRSMVTLLIVDFRADLAKLPDDGKGMGEADLFDVVYFLLSTIREDRSVLLFNLWLMANYDQTARMLKNQLYDIELKLLTNLVKRSSRILNDRQIKQTAFLLQSQIEGILICSTSRTEVSDKTLKSWARAMVSNALASNAN